ncbi:hypothetical protein L6164_021611 [Bauhinia variegata]|uniref:Uncharacterized protein n=1 Tax=Bauhinia variegata TaxID=167791 RepID=A0ACB9MYR8_BAUVA|nr:hypothetical protein L6164_021611 [Bauhinia variegata]
MASSTNSTYYYYYYPLHGPKVAITVVFIFLLTLLPPKSGGSVLLSEESKMVIGSKPPACVNKCSTCRPCIATLVVPKHQRKDFKKVSSHGEEDDSYYLLSWKCRCGNKLFQP